MCSGNLKQSSKDSCEATRIMQTYNLNDQVARFLRGLNDNFSGVRSQILLLDPLPSISRVLFLALQHECQLLNPALVASISQRVTKHTPTPPNTAASDALAFAAPGSNFRKSWNGNKRPHCTYCNGLGHTVDKCFKKHGYPPNFRPKGQGRGGSSSGNQYSGMANNAAMVTDVSQELSKLSLSPEQLNGLMALVMSRGRESLFSRIGVL